MATYKNLEAAAKAFGKAHGVTGRAGGWLYRSNGARICHGWRDYGVLLIARGQVHVLDEHGRRIDREKTARGLTVRAWRTLAQYPRKTFVIPEPDPATRRLVAVPDAVAVDTSCGYVFRNAEDGLAFTVEGAKAFAARRNEGLKVPAYKVYSLTLVEDEEH
jgi:hypothetical protein